MAANKRDLRIEIPSMRAETEQALARALAPELRGLADLLDRHDWPWPTWHAIRGGRHRAHRPVCHQETSAALLWPARRLWPVPIVRAQPRGGVAQRSPGAFEQLSSQRTPTAPLGPLKYPD
jgi:hypothetical protein